MARHFKYFTYFSHNNNYNIDIYNRSVFQNQNHLKCSLVDY